MFFFAVYFLSSQWPIDLSAKMVNQSNNSLELSGQDKPVREYTVHEPWDDQLLVVVEVVLYILMKSWIIIDVWMEQEGWV